MINGEKENKLMLFMRQLGSNTQIKKKKRYQEVSYDYLYIQLELEFCMGVFVFGAGYFFDMYLVYVFDFVCYLTCVIILNQINI